MHCISLVNLLTSSFVKLSILKKTKKKQFLVMFASKFNLLKEVSKVNSDL